MEIYLIRHTTPDIEKGIVYGQLDLNLRESFDEEAESVLKHLPESFDTICSSPLKRCLHLAQKMGAPVLTDSRIQELDFGEWEGEKWDQIKQKELNHWMSDFVNRTPPQGESLLDLRDRVLRFWKEIRKKQEGTIAVVTHAGVIRMIYSIVTETPLENIFDLNLDYGSVLKAEVDGKIILVSGASIKSDE
ncbi:MAG: alpha-ribazole phosphatase [Balneolaceae bacterium]|nr:alpha-ribazole phosphatase [Balneolaceae bacterium]